VKVVPFQGLTFIAGLSDSSFEAKHTRLHELIGKMDEISSADSGRDRGM